MFGSKKCLVSVLFVWIVVTVVEGVSNDEPTKLPTLKRQKRYFFWWPYGNTEEIPSQVEPYYRITIKGQSHSAVVDDWNTQHAAAIIAELEAAQKRLEETVYKLKNLSIKKLYNSDESYEDESGEKQPQSESETTTRPPLKPYNIRYVPVKTTSPVVRTTTIPPQIEPHPTPATPTITKTDLEAVIINPATTVNSQKVDSATSTQSIDIRVKPDEDEKITTTSATVQITPEQRTKITTPAAVEVRPVQPATTTPAAIEVRPVEPVTTTPAAIEVRPVEPVTTAPAAVEVHPVEPATTTTANVNTNEKVKPQQQVITPETEDVKIQPDQPATTTTAEDPVKRIRPPTTTGTVSDDNADVKIEPQQQSTTVATATVEDSANAAIDNVQPEQPAATDDSSDTTDPEPSVEPRYAAESASLENWKNNKKKISWDYYLKKRLPLNEKMTSKIAAQYARELQADR